MNQENTNKTIRVEVVDYKISKNIAVVERVVIEHRGFFSHYVYTYNCDNSLVDERWFVTKRGATNYAGKVLTAKKRFLNEQKARE